MLRTLPKGETIFYSNIVRASRCAVLSWLISKNKGLSVLVFESFSECEFMYSRLDFFLKLRNLDYILKVLPPEISTTYSDSASFDAFCERTGTLNAIAQSSLNNNRTIILTTAEALFQPAPPPEKAKSIQLQKNQIISIDKLKEILVDFGYYNEVLCETTGQFAVRGGVIDVYPIAESTPIRLDFFGDELESIRAFHPDTQLADEKLNIVRIDAVSTVENVEESSMYCTALDYLPKVDLDAEWFFNEPAVLESKFSELFLYDENNKFSKKNFKDIFDRKDKTIAISEVEVRGEMFEKAKLVKIQCESIASSYSNIDKDGIGIERFESESKIRQNFIKKIASWASKKIDVFLAIDSDGDKRVARQMFKDAKEDFCCKFINEAFGEGFLISSFAKNRPDWNLLSDSAKGCAFIGVKDFFGRREKLELKPRRRIFTQRQQVDQLLDFSELAEGDYVVHLGHGVCRYHGITKLDVGEKKEDVIKLEFQDESYLYLPLHNSYLLSRYIGLDKRSPRLAKLDSKSWSKIKSAAELATFDYAYELLEMQSKRELAKGHSFKKDDEWQLMFEDSFAYTETADQLKAVIDVKEDMQSDRPMDRLLCADVGFGKTEIAMRGAFKAASQGKQVAILCPTTVLCQQHFRNFRERFSGYPIVVEMLSRFRTKGEAEKIKLQLATGKIDIIVGTHALISDSVVYKDLGLLVIDEEHRFGVKHKEKIKKIREGIDVLSMSATPIPRTLYFSMMGAKTISLMETPPRNRYPVETIVREYSDETIKEAISKELSRDGQVFYLHNRVTTIEGVAQKLRNMFPDARVAVGHGQMTDGKLEKLMVEFVDGKYDILVCTTIIESGIDIPNCNTIIIEGADKFGLAQLYQLRGRVGRFTRRAYAWLILHKYASVVESARKRLGAIRQYNKPGAGFRIATRDLQLRGCGNLLGAKQSGHIAGVGFDLYCALLKRSIAVLKGEKCASIERAICNLDFVKMGEGDRGKVNVANTENFYQEMRLIESKSGVLDIVKAYISQDYIPQTQLRVDFYRKISISASIEEIENIEFEMNDRFGKIPYETQYLIKSARIRILAESYGFTKIETLGNILKLEINNRGNVKYFKINEHFPRLTKRFADSKLAEIENFLKNVLPTFINKHK